MSIIPKIMGFYHLILQMPKSINIINTNEESVWF